MKKKIIKTALASILCMPLFGMQEQTIVYSLDDPAVEQRHIKYIQSTFEARKKEAVDALNDPDRLLKLLSRPIRAGRNVQLRLDTYVDESRPIFHYYLDKMPIQYGNERPLVETIEKFLNSTKADPNRRERQTDNTLLHRLANYHWTSEEPNPSTKNWAYLAEILLNDHNLDINAQNHFGQTPLYAACLSENRNYIEFLLSHGADKSIGFKKSDYNLGLMRRYPIPKQASRREKSAIQKRRAKLLDEQEFQPGETRTPLDCARMKDNQILIKLFSE